MDFCFVLCGCETQVKPDSDPTLYHCPRCNNGAVSKAKETNCFTLFCIPVMPLSSERVYRCSICQWTASQNGPAPPLAGGQQNGMMGGPQFGGGGYGQPQYGYPPQQPMQPGYQPGYHPGQYK